MLHHCKWRTLGRAALAAAAGACLLLTPATAQQLLPQRDDPFSALVGKRGDVRQRGSGGVVERYVVATDNRVFLFQSDGRNGRLKFLCGDADSRIDCRIDADNPAEEIYQVTGVRASRGDVVYRDRDGAEMLRLASYGSATVFWPGDDRGHAAARSYSEDPPIALPPALAETAYARVQRATALVSALTGAPIVFEIAEPAPSPDDDATVLADAIARTAKAIAEVAEDPIGARVIASKIKHVRLARGSDAGIALDNGMVTVSYAPGRDLEGRLSSSAIAAFLEESL